MKKYLKYKGVSVNTFGLPIILSPRKAGRESKSLRKYSGYKHFYFNFPISAPKDTIVMFDIPSDKRSERDWLRYQLKGFNYSMLQKGVWVGPFPLPQGFLSYAESIFSKKLIILKLAKPFSNKF